MVSLHGDVVVFPGATLTIKAGTTITFPSQRDRHQFKKGHNGLSEIFVYGTLKSAGASGNEVVFRGPDPNSNAYDWGGIQQMTGGTVTLGDHTTLRNALPPPTIEGLAHVSFDENDTEAIATYAVANPTPYTITWSVSGADVSSFQMDGLGVLSFAEPPNHEQQGLYSVDVVATDGSLADTLTVQVTITDVDDPGTVTLSTDRPQAGTELTATLRDEDGIVGAVAWSQHYVRPDQVGGAVGEPFESTSPELRLSPTLGGYDFYVRAVYTERMGLARRVPKVSRRSWWGRRRLRRLWRRCRAMGRWCWSGKLRYRMADRRLPATNIGRARMTARIGNRIGRRSKTAMRRRPATWWMG